MKLHLPRLLRSALNDCWGTLFISTSALSSLMAAESSVGKNQFWDEDVELSGSYPSGFRAQADASLTNHGTVTVTGSDYGVEVGAHSTLKNSGTIKLGGSKGVQADQWASIVNYGKINVDINSDSALSVLLGASVTNHGSINLSSSSYGIYINRYFIGYTDSASMTNASDGNITIHSASTGLSVGDQSSYINRGDLEISASGDAVSSGGSGDISNSGSIIVNKANYGARLYGNSTLKNTGTYTILSANYGISAAESGTKLVNSGEISINATHRGISASGSIDNSGVVSIESISGGVYSLSSFSNSGTLKVADRSYGILSHGTMSNSGNIEVVLSGAFDSYGIKKGNSDSSFLNTGSGRISISGANTGLGVVAAASIENRGQLEIHASSYGIIDSLGVIENSGRIIVESGGIGASLSGSLINNGELNIFAKSSGINSSGFVRNNSSMEISASALGATGIGVSAGDSGGSIINDESGNIDINSAGSGVSVGVGGTLDNCGGLNIDAKEYGIQNYGRTINSGTLDIEMTGGESARGVFVHNGGSFINYGDADINVGNTYGAYGVYVDGNAVFFNSGNLNVDSIGLVRAESQTRASLYLLHGSNAAPCSSSKKLRVSQAAGYTPIVSLGGSLADDGSVSAVYGGSRVNISSGLDLSSVTLQLQDNVTLDMGGDLNIGSGVSFDTNGHMLTIDNGASERTITYNATYTASWNGAASLVTGGAFGEAGITWGSAGNSVTSKSTSPSSHNLTLKSGTLNVYGIGASYFAPEQVRLESGVLNLQTIANAHLDVRNTTFTWKPTDSSSSVLKLSSDSDAQGITVNVDSTALDVSGLTAQGQKLVDVSQPDKLQFSGTGITKFNESLFDVANGLYNYHGYQKWVDKASSSSDNFWANSSKDVVIYQNDLYYSLQRVYRQAMLNGDAKNWKGGNFVVYDAEKNYYNYSSKDEFVNDQKYCALAVGLNMAEFWLDSYAVLNTSARDLPYLGSKTPASGALNGSYSSSIYDIYASAWRHEPGDNNGHPAVALGWILSGTLYGGTESESIVQFHEGAAPFAEGTWTLTNGLISGQQGFTAKSGMIYNLYDTDGVISDVSGSITRIITQAFQGADAPISIGWHAVKSMTSGEDKRERADHVVTCWGYETSKIINEKGAEVEIVSKLWYTDSDDKTKGGAPLRAYDVIYGEDNRAYLVDTSDGSSLHGHPTYLTNITFMTTPAGMDDMLDDYYDKSKPIYWTGTNTEWKKDNIGGRESQTRLATLSDGWRKQCEGGGRSIWAYTTFSGSKENVVFGESVNGVSVKERRIAIADNMEAGNVRVEGFGYEWKPAQGAKSLLVDTLELKKGSLIIRDSLTVGALETIDVQSGFILVNQGRIVGNVELESGGTLISGAVQVGEVETASALSEGLFIQSGEKGLLNLNLGSGSLLGSAYTLGTTIDFTGSNISQALLTQLQTGQHDVMNNYVAKMFGVDSDSLKFLNTVTNYNLVDDAVNFANTSTRLDGGHVTVSGSLSKTLSLASYGASREESTANLQLSEQHGAQLSAKELTLATLTGERTLINAESSVEAQTLRVVAGSELENDGELRGRVEVEGTLSGSGSFGVVSAHEGGSIVIGNSPGAAEYESLTLKNGSEIVFSVDGLTPAAEELSGWGSGAHSVLTLTGTDALTLEDGAEVKIGFSSDFLTSVEIGKPQTLTLIQGVAANDELLAALQQATSFYYAGLDDSLSSLAENTLYSVHEFSWQAGADNSIALNVTLYYAGQGVVPEPTTTTLSLLALSMLAARRRRR